MIETRKAQELDVVELTEDLPEYGLKKGERGAVVVAFDQPDEAYMLEFVDESGKSRFAYAVKPNQLATIDELAKEALNKGLRFHNEGKGAEAEKAFRRAIELKPDLIDELHNLFLRSCEQQGDSEEMETFERIIFAMHLVLRLNPEYDIARNNIAIAYENQGIIEANKGDLHGAVAKFRIAVAIAIAPEIISCIRRNLALAWTQLGIQAYQKGEFIGLPNYMGLAYEVDPNEKTKRDLALAYATFALWCLGQNNLEGAREGLQIAFDIAGVTSDNYGLLPANTSFLEKAILKFLERGMDDLSFDLQTRQIEFHIPQMHQQELVAA
jgi:tetratricopeptide (TPR) repeat protein